jgi:hypothetical protein
MRRLFIFSPLLILIGLLIIDTDQVLAHRPNPSNHNSDALAVQRAATNFLSAFINLDWDKFRSSFADDATVFFPPSATTPRRVEGKTQIEAVFKSVFDRARKQRPGPPYLTIEPEDMKIQMLRGAGNRIISLARP